MRLRTEALRLQLEAQKALASVQQDVGARAVAHGHTAAAAPAPQVTGAYIAHHDKTHDIFSRRMVAVSNHDPDVMRQIREQIDGAGGSHTAIVVADMIAKYFELMMQGIKQDAPTVTTAESAVPAAPLKTPSARHAAATAMGGTDGDAQLTARVPVKLAAQAQTSATQTAKQAVAGNQRVGKRQQSPDVSREADELSDNGSSA